MTAEEGRRTEPSDAAWRRFGEIAAEALYQLAEREALAAASARVAGTAS